MHEGDLTCQFELCSPFRKEPVFRAGTEHSQLRGQLEWRPGAGKSLAHWRRETKSIEKGRTLPDTMRSRLPANHVGLYGQNISQGSWLPMTEPTHSSWSRKGLHEGCEDSLKISRKARESSVEVRKPKEGSDQPHPEREAAKSLCCCLKVYTTAQPMLGPWKQDAHHHPF